MNVLAEISDKIFLPRQALFIGMFFGLFVFSFALFEYRKHGLLRFLACAAFYFILMYFVWMAFVAPQLDGELGPLAEAEIPGYHMRLRLALIGPSVLYGAGVVVLNRKLRSRLKNHSD